MFSSEMEECLADKNLNSGRSYVITAVLHNQIHAFDYSLLSQKWIYKIRKQIGVADNNKNAWGKQEM